MLIKQNVNRTKIIVITDVGEEIDDEVTLWYLDKMFANRSDVKVHVLFVDGKMNSSERMNRATSLNLNEAKKLEYFEFLKYPYNPENYKRTIILQIGPVDFTDNNNKEKLRTLTLKPYEYILLGDVGKTLNSQDKAKGTAEYFIENSKKHYIVHSKIDGELKVPSFRHDAIQMFPNDLKEEIYKIGFKNTVGRAPKIPFTRHLSGQGGANYQAVKAIYEKVNNGQKIDELEVPDSPDFKGSANEYMNMDKYTDTDKTIAKDFATNNSQDVGKQASDLAKMTFALFKLGFQPDNLIIYSDKIIEDKRILPKYVDSFNKYKNVLTDHPTIEMTPAYDLVAGD